MSESLSKRFQKFHHYAVSCRVQAMLPESERTQRGCLLQCLRLALLFMASLIPTGGTTADTGNRGEVQC